jgi:hypothetical protein
VRVVVRTVSWVLLFASLGAAGASWFTPTPELDAHDARELAADTLAEADVEVERLAVPVRMVHETQDGDTVAAWRVRAAVIVDGTADEIEVRVQESAGQLVYVDDRIGADDTERLLSNEQFETLRAFRDNSLFDRWVLGNALAALAALAIAGTCYLLATRSDPLWSSR